ncbi:MAG: inorganic phosphate transporter [Ruegeria sp.]|uniref:inorganic phosphate transporter n=1 Tax=Ruegeria sp. TaxID=1879320 RepID=UPI00349E4ED8
MANAPNGNQWARLDRELHRISRIEIAVAHTSRPLVGTGVALAFLVLAALLAELVLGFPPGGVLVAAAAVFGAYMALNIGANDVANNMGPVVGARALRMSTAIVIAALAEIAGALLAGSDVVSTISVGIVDPQSVPQGPPLLAMMMAALMAAALFINFATLIGAPVSTTHSIVGGVMGAGIAAAGYEALNWPMMGRITASWIVSPLMGGAIAAAVLALIRNRISQRADKMAAARRWVPILVGIMGGTFAAYLGIKGLGRIVTLSGSEALVLGVVSGLLLWGATIPVIRRQSEGMENRMRSVKALFALPLVIAATLLSFAHGANDVANAVGPLAAIVHAAEHGALAEGIAVPNWVMLIGAFGIAFGLFLFGPRLIRRVGSQITKLNPMRSYCVALSAAVTVILASWLGLPVSSTHIAVGGVFGIGFYREWEAGRRQYSTSQRLAREERRRRKLVRRSHFLTIVAAWVVTVPLAGSLAAGIFWLLMLIV